jgi:hypothetical protein
MGPGVLVMGYGSFNMIEGVRKYFLIIKSRVCLL